MEKTLGIHRDWVQPSYYFETVERWFAPPRRRAGQRRERPAVLFTTCFVNYSDPVDGALGGRVLEHAGVRGRGLLRALLRHALHRHGRPRRPRAAMRERNVAELLPHVEAGAVILVPGPSCSLMLKEEYPRLLGTPDAARRVADGDARPDGARLRSGAREEAAARLHAAPRQGRLPRALPPARAEDRLPLARSPAPRRRRGRAGGRLLGRRRHLGHAGALPRRLAPGRRQDAAARSAAAEPDHVATDCPLAALRIEEGLGRKAVHPIVLLRHAYGIPAE